MLYSGKKHHLHIENAIKMHASSFAEVVKLFELKGFTPMITLDNQNCFNLIGCHHSKKQKLRDLMVDDHSPKATTQKNQKDIKLEGENLYHFFSSFINFRSDWILPQMKYWIHI